MTPRSPGEARRARLVVKSVGRLLSARTRRLLVAGVLVLGVSAVDVLVGGPLTYADRAVRAVASSPARRDGWLDAMGVLGDAGAAGAVLAITALVTMQVLERWWPGVLAAVSIAAVGFTVTTVKVLVARDGPDGTSVDPGEVGYFPSGHTATAVVAVGTAAFLVVAAVRRGQPLDRAVLVGRSAGLAAGCVVALSAVLTAHHWTTDVLASLAFAGAVLEAGLAAAHRYVDGPTTGSATTP